MNIVRSCAAAMRIVAIGWTLSLIVCCGAILAQSDIVFMTADVSGIQEKLVRFDMGVQTFAVDTGANSAFHGVTILNDNVLVADFLQNAIQRFSPDGSYLGTFALSSTPTFLESDSSGNVYTNPSALGAPVATRFNSLGIATGVFIAPTGPSEYAGMDADVTGNVYIASASPGGPGTIRSLLKFAPNGTFLNSTPLGAIRPRDIAIDEATNRLFIADSGSTTLGIKIYDIAAAMPSFLGSVATPANTVMEGIHFAAESGNILATDYGILSNDPRGFELSPGGMLLQSYRPTNVTTPFDITTFVPIPEPTSIVLLFLGMFGFALNQRSARRPPA